MTPPGLSSRQFAEALKAFGKAIGADNVFATEEDQIAYSDLFSADQSLHQPSAAENRSE